MRKFWHQSQPSRFFRSEVRAVSVGHHFFSKNSKKPTNPKIWRLSYPILQHWKFLCICVFDIVFVFVFDFVFAFLSFCICLLYFIHWAGGCQQFSLELINRDDDDEEFLFKWTFGCCHRIRRIWAYTRNYTAQIRKYRNTKTIDRTRRRPPTIFENIYSPNGWQHISNTNIYFHKCTFPTLCPKGIQKPSNLQSSPKCWHDISYINIYIQLTYTPQMVGSIYPIQNTIFS